MRLAARVVGVGILSWLGLTGCGGHVAATSPVQASACTTGNITGTLRDSLTGQAIAGGQVFVESGSVVPGMNEYTFTVAQQALSGADGSFQVCAGAATSPTALVVAALDQAGKSYPAYVSTDGGAAALGTVALGGCMVACGLPGQQQSAAPVTISGAATTDPASEAGSVAPQYALEAPDGSGALWGVVIPTLNQQSLAFTTAANRCAGVSGVCAEYQFLLPSQKPVVAQHGSTLQSEGAPVYAISATIGSGHRCTPSVLATSFVSDGSAPLTGTPGAVLSAATLLFHACS